MTTDELKELWSELEDTTTGEPELKFNKRHDLNAFLLLDSLLPGTHDMVACAEHDEIWLSIDLGYLAETINKKQIRELIRCGVHIDTNADSLHLMR